MTLTDSIFSALQMELKLTFLLVAMAAVIIIAIVVFSPSSKWKRAIRPPGITGRKRLRKAQVDYVLDGDTAVVSAFFGTRRLRLYGIDAPEDGQPWGNVATAGLIKLIGGRTILFERHARDTYGRVLATVFVEQEDSKWLNVNARMVILGHAWVSRKYSGYLPMSKRQELLRMEKWARSRRVGLWKMPNPVPPWKWRGQYR